MRSQTISSNNLIAASQSIKEKKFWLNKLSGEPVKSVFHYDMKPTNNNNTDYERRLSRESFRFFGDLFSKMKQLSNESNPRLHMILVAGLVLLINKYTGNKDIMIGVPVYKQDTDTDAEADTGEVNFLNTALVLRNPIDDKKTFKELLLEVRQTITEATENVNYPIELLPKQLGLHVPEDGDFSLFDISILLENIHDKKHLQHIHHNIAFSLRMKEDCLEGVVEYNSSLYYKETIQRIITHFTALFKQVLFNVNVKVSEIDILSETEKRKLLWELNDTEALFPKNKTIHQWFEDQVERTPGKIAVCSPIDLNDIFTATSCFKKNPYMHESDLGLSFNYDSDNTTGKIDFKLLKTNNHNSLIINHNVSRLINRFDGENNLESIFSWLKELKAITFIIYSVEIKDLLEITHNFNRRADVFSNMDFTGFVSLVKLLAKTNVIKFTAVKSSQTKMEQGNPKDFDSNQEFDKRVVLKDLLSHRQHKNKELSVGDTDANADILLLGDTPGMPTTGLLYIASFLRRNQVKAFCRFYDGAEDYPSMKAEIEELLERMQPKVAAISMKWFLFIARVLEMCRIIWEYSKKTSTPIKIVVGGNTASYYWDKIIENECIDYIIRGDGEVPLLKICQDQTDIPNCVYKNKKDGKIIQTPMTYIKNETNSPDIYLSHLEKITISDNLSRFGTFFIYTHLGCQMNCFYCGGCYQAQQKTFHRKNVFLRGVKEVRKDILEAKKFTSTFQFEFYLPNEDLLDYCKQIWEDIDLSNQFCMLSTLLPPSPALIVLVSKTFKYVYWDLDICTLSERHRKHLLSLGLVKPLPSDKEILDFMDLCEKYHNIEVRPNVITGLPYLTLEDIDASEKLLSKMMNSYSCFGELHWARLHAQPGAPVITNADQYQMHSYASTYEDFLKYSQQNFNQESGYSFIEDLNYPYIYFNDDRMNSRVTTFYLENNKKVQQHKNNKEREFFVCETLSYRELNERALHLGSVLRSKGVGPGNVVGLILERSIEIPVSILAVLKAGAAYLPIDPEYPEARIQYMLNDSNAKGLITAGPIPTNVSVGIHIDSCRDEWPIYRVRETEQGMSAQNLAYVIYTSGTTGKPKGVLLSHRNLVNYVHWFTTAADLTENDKTVLTSSFAFDLGYTSIYTSILNGCELHILPREIYLLAERLLDYIKQKAITYIKVTPSLFSVIVNAPNFSKEMCQSLRLAVIGGEAINVRDIEKARSICSHLQIMNHYGPTEATIGSVTTFIDFQRMGEYKIHPYIGKPIHNTEVYILGKDLNLLPIGVPGELCISGTCLARGYLNQPELTAERFNQDFQDYHDYQDEKEKAEGSHHSSLYRTGDLARWLSNGNIEFLGRIDTQVKLRGYRIELKEIESRLRNHHKIKDALVVVKEKTSTATAAVHKETPGNDHTNGDNKYLCAYIVSSEGTCASTFEPTPTPIPQKKGRITDHKKVVRFRDFENLNLQSSIFSSFNERVREHPDNIAVKSDGRTLTFRSLDQYALQVAQCIQENYEDQYKLSRNERERYKRQMLLHGWGLSSQEKLKSTTVFVAGAGGGASPTIMQLALAGFGTIKVCDFDVVELSNLNRQVLHDDTRIGMNKALSAKMTIERINPNVTVFPITEKLTRENVCEMVGDCAVIFDMFDDLQDKFILSEYAAARGIPHIVSAMTDLNGYAALFHTPHTPCFHCIFDKKKLEEIIEGMSHFVEKYQKNPLPVAATSLFMSTGFAVNEAIKILLGFDHPAYNKFVFFNQRGTEGLANTESYRAMTHTFSDHFRSISKAQGYDWDNGWQGRLVEELTIEPDPHCPVCGVNGKGEERRKVLEEQIEKARAGIHIQEKKRTTREPQTIALLLNHDIDMAAGIVGALKSGKTPVPLDHACLMERLCYILEDSESRIILTNNNHLNLAEKLRDKVNKNIKIINISRMNRMEEPGEADKILSQENFSFPIKTEPEKIAYVVYSSSISPSTDSDSNDSIEMLNNTMMKFCEAFFNGKTYTFESKKKETRAGALTLELKEYLQEELPDYMIPSFFVRLDKIPLTPNGKIDRKSLPDPDIEAEEENEYTRPRNEVEQKLAAIWSEVLGAERDKISIDSNFFHLGGQSLNASIMAARIHKTFDVKLPLVEIFRTPTIRGLSEFIKGVTKDKYASIMPAEKREYYALSSAQRRLYLLQQSDLENSVYNISEIVVLEEEADRKRLEETFGQLIHRHESLRTSFEVVEGEPVQRIHEDAALKIEYHEFPCTQDEVEVEGRTSHSPYSPNPTESIIRRFLRSFDLSRAPLLRVGLLKIEKEKHMLMVDMHHIISDGVSHMVLIKDFTALYDREQLSPLRLHYKDFSQWQNQLTQSGEMQKQEAFWLKEFSGQLPELTIPMDYVRPPVRSFEGDAIEFELGSGETRFLKEMAEKQGATLFIVLLAVYNVLLAKLGGKEDIIVGTGVAGRRHADLEKIIGMFVNTLALRNYPTGEKPFNEFIKEVKERTLNAFENQDYLFEDLLENIGSKGDVNRNPLFDTIIMVQNMEMEPGNRPGTDIPEIKVKSYDKKVRTAKFDISFYCYEGEETLFFTIEYCTRLFKKATIELFFGHFKKIVSFIMENENIQLKEIVLPTALGSIKSTSIQDDQGDFLY
jgi:amino acid adenylation domain-containing protein